MTQNQGGEFVDRKGWLVFFGIVELLLGVLAVLGALGTAVGMIMAIRYQEIPGMVSEMRAMVPSILMYVAMAAFFLVTGIGSIRARRWAHAVMLVFSWLWLVTGIMGITVFLITLPRLIEQLSGTGVAEAPQLITAIVTVMGVFMSLFYVILPAVFILFHSRANVRETCRKYDPDPCWTDQCPLPVLSLVFLLLYGVLASLMSIPFRVMPCFGLVLTGAPAIAAMIVVAFVTLWAAGAVYRLDIRGWWVSLAVVVLGFVSGALTFSRVNLEDFYRQMGFGEKQMEAIRVYDMFAGPQMILWMLVPFALYVVYLLCLHRYFRRKE